MSHNGGRSQTNLSGMQTGGEYAYLNHVKTAQAWSLLDNSGPPAPNTLNVNGYPTSLSNGGVYTFFLIPSQANRPGNYVVRAVGDGTVALPLMSYTLISGSLSGVNPRCVITPTGTVDSNFGALDAWIGITAINAGNPITKLEFVHVDDEYRLDLPTPEVFGVKFKQRLAEGNCGVYRFIDWALTNNSLVSQWAHRKPIDYVFYTEVEPRASLYAGVTTNSGDNYSVAFPGFVLVDKATVIVQFNADAGSVNVTLNTAGSGAIPVKGPGGSVLFNTQQPKAGKYATLIYDADLNAYIKYGGDLDGLDITLINGAPPELMVRLCNEMGAHPWFCVPYLALDPSSDYATSLATYCRDNLAAGLVPRFEPSNEIWNTAGAFFGTTYAANKANAHWGTSNDWHNWYGKVLSTMGQDISAVYGGDRSRYQIVCGVQTGTGGSASASDDRLKSTKYVTVDGGSAAKNWVTHVAVANYWNSSLYGTQTEIDLANEYPTAIPIRKAAIISQYVNAGATGSAYNALDNLDTLYVQWKAWGVGLGVNGLTGYEGGWSPDYTGNATLDALRSASKASALLNGYTATNYNNFLAAGGVFPSCFTLSGPKNVWSVFDPDIYTSSPQVDAIVAFNAVSTGLQVTLTPIQVRFRPMDWSWLEYAYNEALAISGQLGAEAGFRDGLDEGLRAGQLEADLYESGLEPDANLLGKRKKKERQQLQRRRARQ